MSQCFTNTASVGTDRNLITTPTAAADYLKWSDQFESDFSLIREALKRPYVRIDTDYDRPFEIAIPNFIAIRTVAQTLAQRAHCHLLLGQPEDARRDLTLLRDLCRMLEGRPTGKPMTLVAAMINVAITGLYAHIIAEGTQSHSWQEPQLMALQSQLGQINLVSIVAGSFNDERAAISHTLERNMMFGGVASNLQQRLKDLVYRLAQGQYPEALDALVPQFLAPLPPDLIGGQPPKYQHQPNGSFTLYSIGWNEKNDGGTPPKNDNNTEGDWVWHSSSK